MVRTTPFKETIMQRHAVSLFALTAMVGTAAAAPADDSGNASTTGEINELRSMVKSLQQQVDELKSADASESWLTQE
jgi:hypothetical protein